MVVIFGETKRTQRSAAPTTESASERQNPRSAAKDTNTRTLTWSQMTPMSWRCGHSNEYVLETTQKERENEQSEASEITARKASPGDTMACSERQLRQRMQAPHSDTDSHRQRTET